MTRARERRLRKRDELTTKTYAAPTTGRRKEVDAYENEGKAEELAHVEGHVRLEIDLVVLEKLDEKTEGEDGGETQAEKPTGTDALKRTTLNGEKNEEEKEVKEGFV